MEFISLPLTSHLIFHLTSYLIFYFISYLIFYFISYLISPACLPACPSVHLLYSIVRPLHLNEGKTKEKRKRKRKKKLTEKRRGNIQLYMKNFLFYLPVKV